MLAGDAVDLEQLSKSLKDLDLKVFKGRDDYYLTSRNFSEMSNHEEVRKKAEKIVLLLNGALKLALDSRKTLSVGHVTEILENGAEHTYVIVTDSANGRDFIGIEKNYSNGRKEVHNPADIVASWLELAENDLNVSKALRHMASNSYNWGALYNLYEIIRDDCGGEKQLYAKGFLSRTSAERFRRTANSPSATKEEGRHAIEHCAPPANPMSLVEATTLIKSLFLAWLSGKIVNQYSRLG